MSGHLNETSLLFFYKAIHWDGTFTRGWPWASGLFPSNGLCPGVLLGFLLTDASNRQIIDLTFQIGNIVLLKKHHEHTRYR
jgi:hypothetical protein